MEKSLSMIIPLNKIDIKTSDNRLYFDILKDVTENDNNSPIKHNRRTKTEMSDGDLPSVHKHVSPRNLRIL